MTFRVRRFSIFFIEARANNPIFAKYEYSQILLLISFCFISLNIERVNAQILATKMRDKYNVAGVPMDGSLERNLLIYIDPSEASDATALKDFASGLSFANTHTAYNAISLVSYNDNSPNNPVKWLNFPLIAVPTYVTACNTVSGIYDYSKGMTMIAFGQFTGVASDLVGPMLELTLASSTGTTIISLGK